MTSYRTVVTTFYCDAPSDLYTAAGKCNESFEESGKPSTDAWSAARMQGWSGTPQRTRCPKHTKEKN